MFFEILSNMFACVYNETVSLFERIDARNASWIAYLYAVLGMFFLACQSLFVKLFAGELPVYELVFYRSFFIMFFNFA